MVDNFKKNYFITDTIYITQRTKIDKAVRVKDNLPVIIKALNIEYPTEKDLKRFANGFYIVHNQNNDKLIQKYEFDLDYGRPAFAMEDTGGISLDHMISKRSLSIAQFLKIALKILDNLKHIHDCQIIHQDINPSNIIWNAETSEIKIIDFEMAIRKLDKGHIFFESDQIQGSLAYISPEQTGRINHSVDYRSDFYSLGVTFYELLTQQKPFISNDYLEKRFPDFILKEKQSDSDTSTLLDNVDLKTIIRTTQTIAIESSSNRQFENITKFFAESSGAQKGILSLNINNKWKVKSIINIYSNTDFDPDCMTNVNVVPLSIINYVAHSKKEVILYDATQSVDFRKDPYIVNNQVKSILCLPLLNKGNINGIMYLENKTIPYLFTKKICKVLKTISVQLSLLIENYIMGQHYGNLDPINATQKPLNDFNATHSNGDDLTPDNHRSENQNSIQLNNNNETDDPHKTKNNEQSEVFKKYKISAKELEIIHFIRDGLRSKEIADEMNLSVETISTYRKRIRKKLGITNKHTSLAFFANNNNILEKTNIQ